MTSRFPRNEIFQSEMMGQPWQPTLDRMVQTWQPTSRHFLADAAAEMYDWHCERFDRTVCTGEIVNGSIRPVTMNERGLITQNAREFRRMLLIEYGLTPREFQDALRHLHGTDRR